MKNEFKHIAKLIKANSKVLEVGCGDGELMKLISNNITSDIRGLEISKKNVQKCISKGLTVIEGNAEQDLKEAKLAISKFSENEKNPQKIKALQEISKAEARIQAAKN